MAPIAAGSRSGADFSAGGSPREWIRRTAKMVAVPIAASALRLRKLPVIFRPPIASGPRILPLLRVHRVERVRAIIAPPRRSRQRNSATDHLHPGGCATRHRTWDATMLIRVARLARSGDLKHTFVDSFQMPAADEATPAVQEAVNLVVVRVVLVPLHAEELRVMAVTGDGEIIQPKRLAQSPGHRQDDCRLPGGQDSLILAVLGLPHVGQKIGVVEE